MFERPLFGVPDNSLKLGIGVGIGLALGTMATATYLFSRFCKANSALPPPGPNKQDPAKLDKMHDQALADSMAASDPPSTVMPEVHS